MVHENFRWQTPMRRCRHESLDIGDLFFARIQFRTNFDIYSWQPYLAEDRRFIIYDLGIHLLDLTRYFLGEAEQLYCHTRRVNPAIRGEDTATIMLKFESGATGLVEISYASLLKEDIFPQTLIHLEGSRGSVILDPHYTLTKVTGKNVKTEKAAPKVYPWSTTLAAPVQESVVSIQNHYIECLKSGKQPETSGEDNIRTLQLVLGAYDSAESGIIYKTPRKKIM